MQATARADRNRVYGERSVPLNRLRFSLICLFFLVWAGIICGRLFWLQVVRHGEYVERAQKQQQWTLEIPPRRGSVYDRNLRELAVTVQVDSLYAAPQDIDDKKAMARQLSEQFARGQGRSAAYRGSNRRAPRLASQLGPHCAWHVDRRSGAHQGVEVERDLRSKGV